MMSNLVIEPQDFELERTTVWSLPKRGAWATHGNNAKFRGNWAPQIPRNLILRYTQPGDLVLDQMCGSGTTLIECKLTGRNARGLDINQKMVDLSQENLSFPFNDAKDQVNVVVEQGDAREIKSVADNRIDLIATHPPYADIIRYSEGKIAGDLSNIHCLNLFYMEMKKVAAECWRVLKPSKHCCILIGDTRRKKYFQLLAYNVMQVFLDVGFELKEDIIKHQWNCKTTPYWTAMSKRYNFLLIMHEHLFIFGKIAKS